MANRARQGEKREGEERTVQVWLGWSAVGLRVGSLESLTLMGGNNLGGALVDTPVRYQVLQ